MTESTALGFRRWAETPPMGWNSWDCFGTTVTEEQVRAQAEVMARELLPHGWQYLVVDIQWYEPAPSGHAYRAGAPLTMDEFGRLWPAPNRFPSSLGEKGFAPLAESVHSLGLRFGIHLMRGIPRLAVEQNLRVWGTDRSARDIANPSDVCPWNPDMYGVNLSKPGAQAYYDSVFELLASWGVDYVKVDDISRPYHDHEREIEAIRTAIDKTGREMVLSLSPGETAITASAHVQGHANLWRISDDFWDNWLSLREQFARVRRWNEHRRLGNWPDADMLPLGVLDLGRRRSRFTREEQLTVMSLWAIVRSPLMFGGDMTQLDDELRALLVNGEVLAVNQHSENNVHLFDREGLVAWAADVPNSTDRYLALFNARDRRPLLPEAAAASVRLEAGQTSRVDVDLTGTERLVLLADDDAHNALHHYIAWGRPSIVCDDGRELTLSTLAPEQAISWWGTVAVDRGDAGRPLSLAGEPQPHALGAHTKSYLEYRLPDGAKRFTSTVGFDDSHTISPGARARFLVFTVAADAEPKEPGLAIEVLLEQLGFDGAVQVRDLWLGQPIGEFSGRFAPTIAWHGAGLYRISGKRT
jgi:hypothetical protein